MPTLKKTVSAVLALALAAGAYTFAPMALQTWKIYEAGTLDVLTQSVRQAGPLPFTLPFLLKHAGVSSVVDGKMTKDGGHVEKRYLAVTGKKGAPVLLSISHTGGWSAKDEGILEKYQALRNSDVVVNWGLQPTPVAKWPHPTLSDVLSFDKAPYVLARQCDAKDQVYEAGSSPDRKNPGAIRGPLGAALLVKGGQVLPKDIARVVDVELQAAVQANPGANDLVGFMSQYKAGALQAPCPNPDLPQSLTFPALALGMTRGAALAVPGLPPVTSDTPNQVSFDWPGGNGRQGRLRLSFESGVGGSMELSKISVIQKFSEVSNLNSYATDLVAGLATQHGPATELRWGADGYWYKSWGAKKSFLAIHTTDPKHKVPPSDAAFFGPTTLFVEMSAAGSQ